MVYLSLTHDIQTQAEVLTIFCLQFVRDNDDYEKKGKNKTCEHCTDKF